MPREGRRGGARDFYKRSLCGTGYDVTDEKDIEDHHEMYGPICWLGYDHDLGIQEVDVVRNHEGVQLQGHIHMVQVWKGKRNGLYAQTPGTKEARGNIAVGLHHRAKKKI